jgi:DNA-binding IclR family transcriptional regulator
VTLGLLQDVAEPSAVAPPVRGVGVTHSVNRAVSLLEEIGIAGSPMTLTELAARAGLSKSTALRLLQTLQMSAFVTREGGRYGLGERFVELAVVSSAVRGPWRSRDLLRNTAMPFLQHLYDSTRETVNLAVLEGGEVIYLESVFGHGSSMIPSRMGARFSATCTALGKAILANSSEATVQAALRSHHPLTRYSARFPLDVLRELRQVQDLGVAIERQETLVGFHCVAAPIVVPGVNMVAAVSVSGSTSQLDIERAMPLVQRAASHITRAFGARFAAPAETGQRAL